MFSNRQSAIGIGVGIGVVLSILDNLEKQSVFETHREDFSSQNIGSPLMPIFREKGIRTLS